MSDQAQGAATDVGQTAQRGINQANEAQDQLVKAIRERPLGAILVAIGIGYLLGKIS